MDWGVPTWVERDFRGYLRCGILAHGFARLRCGDCGHDRLLAFSCKGRGVCPSCNARRMAKVAAHLTDEVLPHLPVRQWVLSVPKRLRPFLHETPEVASAVPAIFLRALRSALRDASPGAPAGLRDVQFGAISCPQRFGNSLNPHYHYHVLALDGVISGDVEHGVRFHEATGLEARDAENLACTVELRVLRWFARHELLDPSTVADMRTWRGTGGFSVDGSVRIEGEDRAGLERLIRYCARGPLALERLHAPAGLEALSSPDARLVYRLPEPDMHGREVPRLTPIELLERLARLVPPPRIHRHRYHGVLAPNARLRSTVGACSGRSGVMPCIDGSTSHNPWSCSAGSCGICRANPGIPCTACLSHGLPSCGSARPEASYTRRAPPTTSASRASSAFRASPPG